MLNKKATTNNLQTIKIRSWTQFKDDNDYLEIMKLAEAINYNDQDYSNMPLAEMELTLSNSISF